MLLTWSQSHKLWMTSSGNSSQSPQLLSGSMCRAQRLDLVGKDSFDAHHRKCLTLLGTLSLHIPFHKGFEAFGLDEPAWDKSDSFANSLYALLTEYVPSEVYGQIITSLSV